MPDSVLSESEKDTFRQDGFAIVRQLFDGDEMRQIEAWTNEVVAMPEVPGKHMVYYEDSLQEPGKRVLQRIENFTPYHEGFEELFNGSKMLDPVSELFGEPAVLFKDKINFKLPGGGGFKLHQDQEAGGGVYADLFITMLISIDETTLKNGCLELAVGHHVEGLIGREWQPLNEEDTSREGLQLVPFASKSGDAAIFDSFVPHQSKANHTNKPRRVLYVTYNKASAGDCRRQYYTDKRKNYPPDIEREKGKNYVFRV
ncbi:MAG: phytanoyl-CoA dioxygenase family protein [Alphaproteobacteria bacterium]|nr:phytanoyl-CoA dioxygenase family protein [Alphaproteobacteria bacterium]